MYVNQTAVGCNLPQIMFDSPKFQRYIRDIKSETQASGIEIALLLEIFLTPESKFVMTDREEVRYC